MHRDYRLYLDDILDAIRQVRSYVKGQDEEAFAADRKTQDAVIRNMEIIGEAAGKLRGRSKKPLRKSTGARLRRCETFLFTIISE